jgi:hypothetical protein
MVAKNDFRRLALGLIVLALAAGLLACGSLIPEALANGVSHRTWQVERDFGHGWGWDSVYGYYAGPFFGRKGGYFRCFDPGYGWHSCPHYSLPNERRRWGSRWRPR